MPARDIGTVQKSFRYIASGSAVFAPSSKATPGAVGVTMKSKLLEGGLEVVGDQRADLLRLAVVGVVVAGGERVGADHDAAFDLVAEARLARLGVHASSVRGVLGAEAVADAVVAGEVRRALGGRDQVVGGERRAGSAAGASSRPSRRARGPGRASLERRLDAGLDALAGSSSGTPRRMPLRSVAVGS